MIPPVRVDMALSDIIDMHDAYQLLKKERVTDFLLRCRNKTVQGVTTPQHDLLMHWYNDDFANQLHPDELKDIEEDVLNIEMRLSNSGIKHGYVSALRILRQLTEIVDKAIKDLRAHS